MRAVKREVLLPFFIEKQQYIQANAFIPVARLQYRFAVTAYLTLKAYLCENFFGCPF